MIVPFEKIKIKKKEPRVSSPDTKSNHHERAKRFHIFYHSVIADKSLRYPEMISEKSEKGKMGNSRIGTLSSHSKAVPPG